VEAIPGSESGGRMSWERCSADLVVGVSLGFVGGFALLGVVLFLNDLAKQIYWPWERW